MSISIAQYEEMLANNPEVKANEQDSFLPTEAQEQMRLFAWINANMERYPDLQFAFHPANGEYRHPATAGKLKAMGVRPGVPDVLFPLRCDSWTGLAIELKRSDGKNKATGRQQEWLHRLHMEGWRTAICYGANEAIDVLREYVTEVTR